MGALEVVVAEGLLGDIEDDPGAQFESPSRFSEGRLLRVAHPRATGRGYGDVMRLAITLSMMP